MRRKKTRRYHLLNDLGLYKQTMVRRLGQQEDKTSEFHQTAAELLFYRTQLYTLAEIELMVRVALAGPEDGQMLEEALEKIERLKIQEPEG